jgi:hypothetical protein
VFLLPDSPHPDPLPRGEGVICKPYPVGRGCPRAGEGYYRQSRKWSRAFVLAGNSSSERLIRQKCLRMPCGWEHKSLCLGQVNLLVCVKPRGMDQFAAR